MTLAHIPPAAMVEPIRAILRRQKLRCAARAQRNAEDARAIDTALDMLGELEKTLRSDRV